MSRIVHRTIDEPEIVESELAPRTVVEPTTGTDPLNLALRVIAGVAGAIPFIIGLVAIARINWSAGFDAAPVDVAGMPFTPAVALGTAALGLLAMAAGASWDRDSKFVMGGILICGAIAIFVADGVGRYGLTDRHGWMALIVGVVLLVAGFLLRPLGRGTVAAW